MERIWKFFEHMDEIVYVADRDTYELQYMNRKALDAYGLESLEEIEGRKCYEVLQGCSCPCAVCTNECLQEGYFYEWKYYNPILGKTYALKDTMIKDGDRRYRMELAVDMSVQEQQQKTIKEFSDHEAMINKGLRIALAEPEPVKAIEALLQYLGQALKSERVYIFEEGKVDNTVDNTYEWCASGVTPQMENLQAVPFEAVEYWYQSFKQDENIIIKDLELIKDEKPSTYEYLKPQSINSLVVSPLIDNNRIIGFYGVDNPPGDSLNNISTMFWIMGHFMVSLLKKRNLIVKLESLSYYDQLTGIRNRHAMDAYFETFRKEDSIGVLYGDVMGLKHVNDTQGHHAGDALLLRAVQCLKRHFKEEELFRIGGDEFLVLYKKKDETEFIREIELLKEDMKQNEAVMALGYIWENSCEKEMDQLLMEADERMYEDKRTYYANGEHERRHKINQ